MIQSFLNFVAIKQKETPADSVEYKSIKSFTDAVKGYEEEPVINQLKVWLATMIEKDLSPATRKRYAMKLVSIYKEYDDSGISGHNPFDSLRKLFDSDEYKYGDFRLQGSRLQKAFPSLLKDAISNPALAVFLYMLFDASQDMTKAISLTTEEYTPRFPQLDKIIKPADFHHRRRYIFNLNQNKKRIPQLTKEVISGIELWLLSKGIKFSGGFSPTLIPALWSVKARETGISLVAIRALLTSVPQQCNYLSILPSSEISPGESDDIKRKVAEAYAPSGKRWFAMKLMRGSSYEGMTAVIKEKLPDIFSGITFFYPRRESARREGKKIIKGCVPVIPDVVFFRTMPHHVKEIDRMLRLNAIGWIYRVVNTPDSDYSVIDNASMLIFERTVGELSPDMTVELTHTQPLSVGKKVRITGGVLAGYEGVIYDIKSYDTPLPSQSSMPSSSPSPLRQIYIRLSSSDFLKIDVTIDESFIEPIS